VASSGTAADKKPEGPLQADRKAVEWFRDAKLGMFVHWGVYSQLGRGEWVMQNEGIPIRDYENLPPRFNPTGFDAREWVRLAKESGIRYITITSKHHDGFAMWDSKVSEYDIVDRTPYGKDVLKQLASECRKQGIKLFFYYSQLDWHHPDYFPRGGTGLKAGRPARGDWAEYKKYYFAQVRELCTDFGEIGGIWFDGWWDRPDADWGHDELYRMIHELQPKALIGNNHHRAPFPGEDFQMFEQDLPGENSAGFNKAGVSDLPRETCRTINNSWGLNTADTAHRPVAELIRYLVQAAGRDANLLLNTGPLPTGEILPEHRERYLAIGNWLKKHGDSVYGTRGGPVQPQPWGVTTARGSRVYVHVLNWPADNQLALPGFSATVRAARTFTGRRLTVRQSGPDTRIELPAGLKDPIDTILVLDVKGDARRD
jgi:alpha-L-fucosidase